MNKYYEDEDICRELIGQLEFAAGEKRRVLLRELCGFKTKAADEFWSENSERFLPYVMMCRSDRFSDYCAEKLTDFADAAVQAKDTADMAAEAYFILSSCLFKESDRLFYAYAHTAEQAKRLRSRHINWGVSGAVNLMRLPGFLAERLGQELENDSMESDLFSRMNDVIIATAAHARRLEKDEETVTVKVKELYEKHPEVFAAAGFYVYFTENTSLAYDKFVRFTYDPISYPPLLWVLGGLSFGDGTYSQNAPAVYLGEQNEFLQMKTAIDDVDVRWFEFLCEKPFKDIDGSAVKNPYYRREFLDNFTFIVSSLADVTDEKRRELCREHLLRAAQETGSAIAMEGLAEHGFVSSKEQLMTLTENICKNIADGKCPYCFHSLFSAFTPENCDVQAICDAVELAADLMEKSDSAPEGAAERMWLKGFAGKLSAVRHIRADTAADR